MSLPPINPFAGMAAVGPNDFRAWQSEREQHRLQGQLEARAAGDGESAPAEASTDRDADGRQSWERRPPRPTEEREDSENGQTSSDAARPHPRDPHQERGLHLDVDG